MSEETVYQDVLDETRMSGLKPYQVEDSGKPINQVLSEVNYSFHAAYGPDFRLNPHPGKILVDPPIRYEELLKQLLEIDGMKLMTNRDMERGTCPADEIWCNIRHDVDGDIRAAIDQAEIEAKYGAKTTFFILHTAPYYGLFDGDVFKRNDSMIHVYKEMQDLGHEIALHSDALLIYQDHNIDGGDAIRREIDWLRENGIDLVGTVSHNSHSVYGANNYSVFKGRPCIPGSGLDAKGVIFKGKWAPLQILDEQEMGLEYEGNDLCWQKELPVEYAVLRSQDCWRYASNMHGIRSKEINSGRIIDRWVGQDKMIEEMHKAGKGRIFVVSVHPLYYGLRHANDSAPTRSFRKTSCEINKTIGWTSCTPLELEGEYCEEEGKQRFQSINMANEIGMLDRSLEWTPVRPVQKKILFMGRDNMHGRTCALDAQMNGRILEKAFRQNRIQYRPWKLATPAMGFTRMDSWLGWAEQHIQPEYVVIGIGADEIEVSVPKYWTQTTGFALDHAPGNYSWVDENLQVVTKPVSKRAHIHASKPSATRGKHSLTVANAGLPNQTEFMNVLNGLKAVLAHTISRIETMGAVPILLVEECGESTGVWQADRELSDKQQAYANFRSYLSAILPREDLIIVDPYPTFLGSDLAKFPCHWDDIPEWNHRGQEVATGLLLDAINQLDETTQG